MVKINITLNQSSINNAIKQLKEIKQQIETKKDIIAKEVAEQGKDYIVTRYNQLPFQKTNPDPKFYVEKTSFVLTNRKHIIMYELPLALTDSYEVSLPKSIKCFHTSSLQRKNHLTRAKVKQKIKVPHL